MIRAVTQPTIEDAIAMIMALREAEYPAEKASTAQTTPGLKQPTFD